MIYIRYLKKNIKYNKLLHKNWYKLYKKKYINGVPKFNLIKDLFITIKYKTRSKNFFLYIKYLSNQTL